MYSKPLKQNGLKNLETLARLMDSQFRIPGTNIKFGFDALVGVIPGIGDFAGFIISGYMMTLMAKNGASSFLLARMAMNVLIDSLVGAIPVLGDIFDIAFKANQRNMKLMREHYVEGRHRGSAWKVFIPLLLILFVFVAGVVWIGYKLLEWVVQLLP